MDISNDNVILSAICPTLNERRHIDALLAFFTSSQPAQKELYIVDGLSTDGTQEIIARWQTEHPNVHLLENPCRYVSHALNLAIPKCRGAILIRLDAHTEYASDYFEQIITTFERTQADIVGGPTRTKSTCVKQSAVAYAICTRFGIGNSLVHQEDYEGPTDSVTFGAWRREVFETIGYFDTEMVRNQDDEFHYRAKSAGLTIYQNPSIRLYYYPRRSLSGLASQYFQYGFYKPAVLRKVPSEWKARHLLPSMFVIYSTVLPLLIALHWTLGVPLLLYTAMTLYFSFFNVLPFRGKLACLAVYPTIHLSYGIGFVLGLIRLSVRSLNK